MYARGSTTQPITFHRHKWLSIPAMAQTSTEAQVPNDFEESKQSRGECLAIRDDVTYGARDKRLIACNENLLRRKFHKWSSTIGFNRLAACIFTTAHRKSKKPEWSLTTEKPFHEMFCYRREPFPAMASKNSASMARNDNELWQTIRKRS